MALRAAARCGDVRMPSLAWSNLPGDLFRTGRWDNQLIGKTGISHKTVKIIGLFVPW